MGGYFPGCVIYLLFSLFMFFLNCGFNGLPMETILFFPVSSNNNNTTDNDSCTTTYPAQLINHKTVANFYLLSVVVVQFCLYYFTFKWHKERGSLTLKPLFLLFVAMQYVNLQTRGYGEKGGGQALISSMHTAHVALLCLIISQEEKSGGSY